MEQPVYYWDSAIGPSSMAFHSGRLIPEWRNNLFVAAHAGQHLVRLVLDGALWVLTDSADGRLVRLAPASR